MKTFWHSRERRTTIATGFLLYPQGNEGGGPTRLMHAKRDKLAEEMWEAYQSYLAQRRSGGCSSECESSDSDANDASNGEESDGSEKEDSEDSEDDQ
jgi:hypothetical protein